MTSVRSPGNRKRAAPSEVSGEDGQPFKRFRTTLSAAGLASDITNGLLRGAAFIGGIMADWLITPRTDFRSLYNVKPKRTLAQGQLTHRPGYAETETETGSVRKTGQGNVSFARDNPYSNRRYMADTSSQYPNKSRFTSFRFASNNVSTMGDWMPGTAVTTGVQVEVSSASDDKVRPSVLPSEKYARRRSGENFKAYTNTNVGPRLFAKSPRRTKYHGNTLDRVRNLEEKNNYARLLATMRNDDKITATATANATATATKYDNRSSHVTRRSDDVMITSIDKSQTDAATMTSADDRDSTWDMVDDSVLYLRTSRPEGQRSQHGTVPIRWQSVSKCFRTDATPRTTNQRPFYKHSPCVLTNQSSAVELTNERRDSIKISPNRRTGHESKNDDPTFGIGNFVSRARQGIRSRKAVEDVFDVDVAKEATRRHSACTPRTATSRIRDVMRQATSDDVILLDDVVSEKDDVEVELEVLSPGKDVECEILALRRRTHRERVESPDVVAIEPAMMTSSRSRDSLEERLKSIPYADRSWIKLQRKESEERARAFLRSRVEAEMKIKVFNDSRQKQCEGLEDVIRKQLRIAELIPAVLGEETEEETVTELYPELTSQMERAVDSALRGGSPSEVLVDHMRIQIRRADIRTLDGTTWLNDEVINFHMNLMIQRGEDAGKPKVHAFNTFFYQKLIQQGHASLKRWTKKVDIFSKDYVVVPVHLQMHWCMAIVDFRKKEIRYYDSMGGNNNQCLKGVKKYLEDESIDKKKQKFDTSDWKLINAKGPQQMNGSDCGVFSTICAEHVTRNAPLTYTQDLMTYFRRRMIYEILTKKLMQ